MLAHGFFGGFGFGFLIALLIAIWVASDANKRGMNGVGWAIGVFFLCIVFLPIYLIVRKPLLAQQPYGYPPPFAHARTAFLRELRIAGATGSEVLPHLRQAGVKARVPPAEAGSDKK